jgi:polyhydroxybutyrate depolymerase
MKAALLSMALILAAGVANAACPAETGCVVAGGHYRIVLPPAAAPGSPVGAIVFFHGWQGSAEEVVADQGLVATAGALGVALIAPDGQGRTWSYPGSPGRHRDEFAFVDAVVTDAIARFPIRNDRLLAAGFSQGGSMVWWLACRMPARFAAFAPVAGAFWVPMPERCEEPRPAMVHFHGLADGTVPMQGRQLRNGFRQADVRASLGVFAPACVAQWRELPREGVTDCAVAAGCPGGRLLTLCLHQGGHDLDPAWIARAWRDAVEP